MTPVVVSDRLTKQYGRQRAVDDVSFEVGQGEVLGLLGPNGSGKTTILRILTGYLQATSGHASIVGFDVAKQGLEARRHVGYVPEDVPLYPNMQVDEFLRFMGGLRGLEGKALSIAVDRAREQLSLQPMRHRAIAKLSRGYRQRVMIAQALLSEPALLILDEPTNGLDPRQIIEVRELIRALSEQHTILVTSHILSEIERVANNVAILLDGKLLAVQALEQSDEKKLRLRIRGGSVEQVQTLLAAVPGVTRCSSATPTIDETRGHGKGDSKDVIKGEPAVVFVIEVTTLDVAEEVTRALTAAGFGVLEVGETRTDLEGLFLRLTGGALA